MFSLVLDFRPRLPMGVQQPIERIRPAAEEEEEDSNTLWPWEMFAHKYEWEMEVPVELRGGSDFK